MNQLRKKGFSVIVAMVLGLVIILIMIPVVKYIASSGDDKFFQDNNINSKDDFKPYDYQSGMNNEEKIVSDSINSLINSLNALAKGDTLNGYGNKLIKDSNILNYRVTYTSQIDIEDYQIPFHVPPFYPGNHHPTWQFTKNFTVKNGTPSTIESWINVDYNMNWCNDKSEKKCEFIYDTYLSNINCKCDEKPSSPYDSNDYNVLPQDIKQKAANSNLPLIKDLDKVKKIKLEVNYKDGKPCPIETKDENTDYLVWGELEDRNGNGIKGSYVKGNIKDPNIGKKIEDVLTKDQLNKLTLDQKKTYFPNGIITENSGEGCLDSPTFVQCPGIRVYYCGKVGGAQTGMEKSSTQYYNLDSEGNIHSNAGAKFMTVIDNTITKESYSILSSNTNIIQTSFGTFTKGDIAYSVASINPLILPNIIAQKTFGTSQNDPKTLCYGGVQLGNTTYKCDGNTCSVCNFELPQNVSDYNWATNYIAGSGDPKYLLYYEAFPMGEEEKWVMNVQDVGLGALIVEDAVFATIPGFGPIKNIIGKIFSKTSSVSKLANDNMLTIFTHSLYNNGNTKNLKTIFSSVYRNRMIKKFSNDKIGTKLLEDSHINAEKLIKDKNFDDLFNLISKDRELEDQFVAFSGELASSSIFKTTVTDRGSKYIAAFLIGSIVAENDRLNQKFVPVGVDDFGLKVVDSIPAVSGSSQIVATSDEFSYYYIGLVKDQYKSTVMNSLFSQDAQRFFLVSPCKADLKLYQTRCTCKKPSEGFVYMNQEDNSLSETAPSTPGDWIPVSKASVDIKTGDVTKAVKLCQATDPSPTYSNPSRMYTPSCILVDPTIKDGTFCYGSEDASKMIGYAGFGVNFVVSTGLSVAFPGFGYIASFVTQVIIDGGTALITNAFEKTQKWPTH